MAEPGRIDDVGVEQRLQRLDDLLDRLEQVPGATGESAVEAVQLLTEVYGEALARVLGWSGAGVVSRCTDDELVGHLMVLHGLHPDSVEKRVERVLAEVRPHLEARGGGVELLGIESGVARLRVSTGGCGSCSSTDPVAEALTGSVLALAPELVSVETVAPDGSGGQALIPVEALLRRPAAVGSR